MIKFRTGILSRIFQNSLGISIRQVNEECIAIILINISVLS